MRIKLFNFFPFDFVFLFLCLFVCYFKLLSPGIIQISPSRQVFLLINSSYEGLIQLNP